MLEGDILDCLMKLFQHSESRIQSSSIDAFSALVPFGIYLCFCVHSDAYFLLGDCRARMLENGLRDRLTHLFQDPNSKAQPLFCKAFGALIPFGAYLCYFLWHTTTHLLIEDCRTKLLEGGMLDRFIKLFQHSEWRVQSLSIDTFSALVQFGAQLCCYDI